MSNNNWGESVPLEILDIIFLYVKNSGDEEAEGKKIVSQCALTCRHWRGPAQRVFFSEISVRTANELNNLLNAVMINEEIGRWTKSFYYSAGDEYNTAVLLFLINAMFPNLEKLDFLENDLLYSPFTKMLTENSKFTHLKSLPSNPKNKVEALLYMKSLDFLKERITIIELTDDNNNSGSLYQDLHDKLNTYTRLRKAVINLPNDEINFDGDEVTSYFKSIVEKNKLSYLQHIRIESIKDSTYISLYTSNQDTLLPSDTLENIYIGKRSLSNSSPNESFMMFIMNNFHNLKSLICTEDINLLQNQYATPSLSNLYYTTTLQFLKFLSRMHTCYFPAILLSDVTALQLIEDFYSGAERNLVSSTIVNTLTIENSYFDPESADSDTGVIHFQNTGRQYKIHLELIWKKNPVDIDLEQLKAFTHIGRFFDKISSEIFPNENVVTTLDHITRYCSRASDLTLTGEEENSVEPFFHQGEDVKKSTNVKILCLEYLILSQEQLVYIVNQLPSLENLILSNCFMHNTEDALAQSSFHTVYLPTLYLNCLKIVLNEEEFSDSIDGRSYYIKLTTGMGDEFGHYVLTAKYNKQDFIGYSLLENISETVFFDSILKPDNTAYLIHCKSVKKFTIEYIDAENGCGYHKTIDMLSNQFNINNNNTMI